MKNIQKDILKIILSIFVQFICNNITKKST